MKTITTNPIYNYVRADVGFTHVKLLDRIKILFTGKISSKHLSHFVIGYGKVPARNPEEAFEQGRRLVKTTIIPDFMVDQVFPNVS